MAEIEGPNRKALFVAVGACAVAVLAILWLAFFRQHVEVTGRVTLDDQPVTGALVVFVGQDTPTATPLTAQTDAEGNYQLLGPSKSLGVPQGKYHVMVSKQALKDGTVPAGKRLLESRRNGLLLNVLPKIYEDPSTTPLQVEIRSGTNTVDLVLKKQP